MQFVSDSDDPKEYQYRWRFLYAAVVIATAVMFMRLWYLQIMEGRELRSFSEKNRLKQVRVQAPRGLILDRNGQVLVENLPGFEAIVLPQYTNNLMETAEAVGDVLGITPRAIKKIVKESRQQNGPFHPIRIKENLTRDEVFRLKRLRIDRPGLDIREAIIRNYPLKENGAQLFGYMGEVSKKQLQVLNKRFIGQHKFRQGDLVGQHGLEESLEGYIRGHDGVAFVQVDARGREISTQSNTFLGQQIRPLEAIPGNNVILSIDKDVQAVAYESFVVKHERQGSLVAMNRNGEVLAWISSPSFDPNDFATKIDSKRWRKLVNDPFRPLRNRVIQDPYSPGSAFKPFVAAAALEAGLVDPNQKQHIPGAIRFGNRMYHDHLKYGHGKINLFEAIERSSNVFFYRLGIALGIDQMYRFIAGFGLGKKTGIDLKRESSGILPNAAWKKKRFGEAWQPGENLSVAIGQGFVSATPLQMAVAYGGFAFGGHIVRPFVVREVRDVQNRTIRRTEPHVNGHLNQASEDGEALFAPATLDLVREGLRLVANGDRGTARWWKIPGVEIAGKTGTSQVMSFSADQIYAKCEEKPLRIRHHGWFVGYAPANDPKIVVAALAEHACHGSTGAAPVVRDVIRSYIKKYHEDLLNPPGRSRSTPKRVLSSVSGGETSEE